MCVIKMIENIIKSWECVMGHDNSIGSMRQEFAIRDVPQWKLAYTLKVLFVLLTSTQYQLHNSKAEFTHIWTF
jgi:hypothetical protein